MTFDPTRQSARRSRDVPPENADVVIIGCGLGGLMAGALLARRGLRVVALDSHYVAGGCATQFRRKGEGGFYHFDVGLHYVGDCAPGGMIPRLLERVGIELDFVPMDPTGFDTLIFPGLSFRVPVGHDAYEAALLALFPHARRGIRRYVQLLREVNALSSLRQGTVADSFRLLSTSLRHGGAALRYLKSPIADVLNAWVPDPVVRAVLLGQHGDYGLPPSRVSTVLHCGLVNHYLRGAYYPKGGGQVIADAVADVIEAHGGSVCLRRPVERILVENGEAVGVRTEATRRHDSIEIRAKVVLSNADLKRTWLELLGPSNLTAAHLERARNWEMAGALFMTVLGVRGDLADLGVQRSNYWAFSSFDTESAYAPQALGKPPTVAGIYLTSASMKDTEADVHAPPGYQSLEVMTLAPHAPAAWGVPDADIEGWSYRRDARYQETKAAVEEQVMASAEALFPGLRERVVLQESATPLTHARFTRATDGTGYGLASTPEQFMEHRPGVRGPVPGLYQCGASTRAGHGIVGAMRSGEQAANAILRAMGLEEPRR